EVVVLLQMLHIFGYYVSSAPRALHSFPTRRSSDLAAASPSPVRDRACSPGSAGPRRTRWCAGRAGTGRSRRRGRSRRAPARRPGGPPGRRFPGPRCSLQRRAGGRRGAMGVWARGTHPRNTPEGGATRTALRIGSDHESDGAGPVVEVGRVVAVLAQVLVLGVPLGGVGGAAVSGARVEDGPAVALVLERADVLADAGLGPLPVVVLEVPVVLGDVRAAPLEVVVLIDVEGAGGLGLHALGGGRGGRAEERGGDQGGGSGGREEFPSHVNPSFCCRCTREAGCAGCSGRAARDRATGSGRGRREARGR